METLARLTGFDDHERLSLQTFLNACTVPIIYGSGDQAAVQGTGTLFEHEDRLFLVTAAHVLQGIDLARLALPQNPRNSRALLFGAAAAWWSKNDLVDVAVVEIRDGSLRDELQQGWRVLDGSNVAMDTAGTNSFVVAGYPSVTVKQVGGFLVPSTMTQLFTGRYVGETQGEKVEHDFFLTFGRTAKGADGSIATPMLQGMSGASVWTLHRCEGLWNPESVLKIAGIQISYVHERYVRATGWLPIARIFERILL
jgi:hypothetical protein